MRLEVITVVQVRPGGRRRLDIVLAPDYLDGLAELSSSLVRQKRVVAMQEETDLSYLRRLLHGRLEQLGKLARDRGLDVPDFAGPKSSGSTDPARARFLAEQPSRAGAQQRAEERLVAEVGLLDPNALDDEGLLEALSKVTAEEESVSAARRHVHEVLDVLTSEMALRLRDGRLTADDLLPGRS